MIALAKGKARQRNVQPDFRVADIRDALPVEAGEFDLIFSGTAMHYVENIDAVMTEVARVMKLFERVSSQAYPRRLRSFRRPSPMMLKAPIISGRLVFRLADQEYRNSLIFFANISEGRRIFCHHHTISDYFHALASAGLSITELLEPVPPAEFAAKNASRYHQAMRVPVYLMFKAEPS